MPTYIKNKRDLLSHGFSELRRVAIEIADSTIAALDPGKAVRDVLTLDQDCLVVGKRRFDLSNGARIFVIGAGKATFPIAATLDEILGARIHQGLITCKTGQPGSLTNIDIHWASHPLPNDASCEAARRTNTLLREVRPGDIVISCFTGGSSALFVAPTWSISLEDKIETNRLLLGSGASIVEINAVRKHISRVKGGRLVRGLPPGVYLINLTVSDVIDDRMDCVTDPSVPDHSTFADARETLTRHGLWGQIPCTVADHLKEAADSDETCREADLSHLDRLDVLLIKSDAVCAAASTAARLKGFTPTILSRSFEGESRELGRFFAALAQQVSGAHDSLQAPCALIGGGESTVLLGESPGAGGPNQEFAVSFAAALAGQKAIVALGMDTDGTDGPTDIAGGLVDASTLMRARDAGLGLHESLRRHDVSPLLRRLDDAIITGATGTNVNDLKLVLVA